MGATLTQSYVQARAESAVSSHSAPVFKGRDGSSTIRELLSVDSDAEIMMALQIPWESLRGRCDAKGVQDCCVVPFALRNTDPTTHHMIQGIFKCSADGELGTLQ
jgi:hypothetical protein